MTLNRRKLINIINLFKNLKFYFFNNIFILELYSNIEKKRFVFYLIKI